MLHFLAHAIEIATTALAVAGMGYFVAALVAARIFLAARRRTIRQIAAAPSPTVGVSILKSLKGLDPGMLDAFRSHCRQEYEGPFELLFGVQSLVDPAASAVEQLKAEFPSIPISLAECPQQLGTNGKVSTLVQLAGHARHDILLINDSDIAVSPLYLERVVAAFGFEREQADSGVRRVGLVTALYRGRAHGGIVAGIPARLEALGIATDFMASVLLARIVERGLHYGLGSTLAVRRESLEAIGGLMPLVDQLADDYELGARIAASGFRIELCSDVVETAVPEYSWRGFVDHQLRWLRTVRDARPGGYAGLVVTHGLAWAAINVLASGLSPVSLWLLALSFFLRVAMAMTAGAEVLSDRQVLPWLWLLPARDMAAFWLWAAGFAGNTVIWRGERFLLRGGKLDRLSS